MEKLTLALVALVAVLQLVTMFILLTGRKGGRGQRIPERRPGAPVSAGGKPDRGQGGVQRRPDGAAGGVQRKQGDSRDAKPRQGQGGRPQQGQGRPGATAINPMEMSLRDINQRLKNADRDQDNARSARDGDGEDGGNRYRDGKPRQGGGRDGGRNDRGPRRDGNRDSRGRDGGKPERQGGYDGPRPQRDRGQFRTDGEASDAAIAAPAPEKPVTPNDFGAPEEQLQHGRRFAARRRMLPDDAARGGESEPEPAEQYQPQEPREQREPETSSLFDNAWNTPEATPTPETSFDGGQEQAEGENNFQYGR